MNDWFYAWDKHMIRLYHHECSDISGWKNVVEQINKFFSLFFFTDMLKLSSIIVQHNSRVKPQASNQMSRQLCASSLTNIKISPRKMHATEAHVLAWGWLKFWSLLGTDLKVLWLPFPPFFPPHLTAPRLLSYANGRAIVRANSLEFLSTKEKWRWKEKGEKGTDGQRERPADSGPTHIRRWKGVYCKTTRSQKKVFYSSVCQFNYV